jgi:hypothetical protein
LTSTPLAGFSKLFQQRVKYRSQWNLFRIIATEIK